MYDSDLPIKPFMVVVALMLLTYVGYGVQQPHITGSITDRYGKPLSRAKIRVDGTNAATVSDSVGAFSISAAAGNTLLISHSQFYSRSVSVGSNDELVIRLTERMITTPDSIEVLDRTSAFAETLQSTASIYTNELVNAPGPSFLKAIPGRLTGLYTRQNSGVPSMGAGIDLQIRGQAPLILIDGIPRDFLSLEPEAIESITVMKDALATVQYGLRASGGILNVVTRKGQTGSPKISFTTQLGLQNPLNLPQTLAAADYTTLYNEALLNDGLAPVYSDADIQTYRTGSDPFNYPDVDWQDVLINRNTAISRYNLNIEGGGRAASYFVGLDYMSQDGFFKTGDLNTYNTNASIDRYIIRSNIQVSINKNLDLGLNLFGRIQNGNEPGGTTQGILNTMLVTPNNAYPVLNPNGSLGGNRNYSNNMYGMLEYSGYRPSYSRDLSADLILNQKLDGIVQGLWTRFTGSFNTLLNQATNRSKSFAVYDLQVRAAGDTTYQQVGQNSEQANALSVSLRTIYSYAKLELGYDKEFGNNSMRFLLQGDQQQILSGSNLPAIYTNLGFRSTYDHSGKYMLEGAVTYSGLNRFMPGNRFGLFYALGAGWDMAKEDFIADQVSWIAVLKLRATYGRTGNANVGYFVYNQYYDDDTGYNFGAGGGGAGGFTEQTLANPGATWEKADKLNIGLDIGLVDNRLFATVEYFNDRYSDLMQQRGRNSTIIGQDYPNENLGINRYHGTELSATWQDGVGAFSYFVRLNGSTVQSKVLFQDEVSRRYPWMQRTGMPAGQFFGYMADGLYQSQDEIDRGPQVEGYLPVPGDIKYRDLNGDGLINQYDESAIGNTKPLIFYGATFGFQVKGFDLSVSLQGVKNKEFLATDGQEWEFQSNGRYQSFTHHLNRWTSTTGQAATYPRLSIGTNVNNHRASSYWIASGNYLRVQQVDIGYTLPHAFTSRFRVPGIRVFANGLNLFTIPANDRRDPEAFTALYPLQRIVNAGINIKL